ncbi:MAG: hypothetical protein EA398_13850 [Deltaproteobacteria bacterium]|nr:MAG: hypothetical protein EA398_13850 [Deltaproteobacteria bacterium]
MAMGGWLARAGRAFGRGRGAAICSRAGRGWARPLAWCALLALLWTPAWSVLASGEPLAALRPEASERLEALPNLSGRWAQQQVTTSVTRVPVVGEVRSRTETLLILDIAQRGANLTVTAEVCTIAIRNRPNMVRTIIPEEFVRSLGRTTRTARLTPQPSGVRYEQPRFVEVIGARLGDPEREGLPQDASDPRVVDQDGTGAPGVTVRIGGVVSGDVYVVQRGWNRLWSTTLSEETFDGVVEWDNEQVVLGASNAFIRRDAPASPDPSPANNFFRTTRVAPDADCRWVERNTSTLFSR